MTTLATNLPSGFDGTESSSGAPILYPVEKSLFKTKFSHVVNGRHIKAEIFHRPNYCSTNIRIDGDLEIGMIFFNRGRAFAERVSKYALKGVASILGKHARNSLNKARREEVEA